MSQRTDTRKNTRQRMEGSQHQFQIDEELQSLRKAPAYLAGEQDRITLIHGGPQRQEGPLRAAVFAFHSGNALRDTELPGPLHFRSCPGGS